MSKSFPMLEETRLKSNWCNLVGVWYRLLLFFFFPKLIPFRSRQRIDNCRLLKQAGAAHYENQWKQVKLFCLEVLNPFIYCFVRAKLCLVCCRWIWVAWFVDKMLCYPPGVIIPTIPPTPQQFTCPLLMPVLSPVKKHSYRGLCTTCIRQWMYIDFKRRIIVAHQPLIKLLCGLIEVWACSALGHSIKHPVVTLPFACSESLAGDLLPSVHKVPAVRRIAAALLCCTGTRE